MPIDFANQTLLAFDERVSGVVIECVTVSNDALRFFGRKSRHTVTALTEERAILFIEVTSANSALRPRYSHLRTSVALQTLRARGHDE